MAKRAAAGQTGSRSLTISSPYQPPAPSTLCARATSVPPALPYRPKSACLIFPVLTAVIFSPAVPDYSFAVAPDSPPPNPSPPPSAPRSRCGRRKMSLAPSFICTFCWTPQFAPARPRGLGSNGRVACFECWKNILDLSICWVCGEMVVRGEEVISLGWCFWHRACFGCLLCGASLKPPTIDSPMEDGRCCVREGKAEDTTYLPKPGCKPSVGIELDAIPLCMYCEDTVQGMAESLILESGLNNIDKRDGGLSRSRLRMMTEGAGAEDNELVQEGRTPTKTQRKKQYGQSALSPDIAASGKAKTRRTQASMKEADVGHRGAADIATLHDGNNDAHSREGSSRSTIPSTAPSAMYVSVIDPINGQSFQPSRTKPLPQWMTVPQGHHRPWPRASAKILNAADQRPGKGASAPPGAHHPCFRRRADQGGWERRVARPEGVLRVERLLYGSERLPAA